MTRKDYENKRKELLLRAQAAIDDGNPEEANGFANEVRQLDTDYEAAATAQANLDALRGAAPLNVAAASQNPTVVRAAENLGGNSLNVEDTYEFAFMNFVCRSTPIPTQFHNATTGISDTTAVIPKTTVKEIIRELKTSGSIYSQVRHLNIQGGVEVPILTLAPVANWVGEGASEDQNMKSDAKVSFLYHGLECKIAQTLLANVVDIEEFNELFVPLAVEAIIRALEIGVFKGTGTNQMTGITVDTRVPEANIVTISSTDIKKYKGWKTAVFSKIKKAYSKGKFYMAESTYQSEIDGMCDTNGQPVARTNYGIAGGSEYFFGGKAVETVEDDVITPYETAETDDVIAVFADLKNYAINSNMKMKVVHWTDNDGNKEKTKVIVICDGKLLDANGVIIVKKGA